MRNPFFHRQGITDADHFFGRGSLVRSLFEMIASGQCCAVLGERRIGKSSLLAYLADPRVQAAHQLDPERTLTVVLDFLALHTCSPAELWLEILEVLELETEDPKAWQILERVPRDENLSFGTFRRAMRKLKRRGFRVVLLCDEFELAIQNPQFDERFFGALRSLAGSEGVVFVTASRLSLLELGQYREEEVRQKVLGSPFFNIFAEFVVGPFRDYELAEMLSVSLDTTPIRFDRSGIDFLDRLGGRHPYFLQLSAYHLYEELRRAGLGRPTQTTALSSDELRSRLRSCQRAVREKVRRESAKIFRNQWQHSSDIEREMLATLVDEEKGGSVDARIIAQLERRGLVMEAASSSPRQRRLQDTTRSSRRFRLFSELLKTWILDQVTLPSAGTAESRTSLREPLPDLPAVAEASVPERYFILEEIGRGGAGTVFKARDLRLERLVAIKVLDRQIRESPERLEPLLTEARTCAALHHPQIVTIYDIDTERGFLVQEFLPGGSLRDLLEMMPILSLKDVLSLAEDLGVALGAAHQAGVVHRDLKPENVLLTERPPLRGVSRDGSWLPGVKLADFGTALRFGDLDPIRARQAVTGTLAYMAPEQLAGENVGPSADFYSLGVLLHEARFGLRPAKGNESPHPILERRSEEKFLELVSHCLAKNPKERLSSADEFLHEVHDVGAELGELP